MPLFQKSVLNKHLKGLDKKKTEKSYQQFVDYFHNHDRQQNIINAKEEQFQEGFLRELFVKILGYTLNPEPKFNLTTELKNEKGAKKADGAILKNGKALAVIELKGTDTKDLDKINTQAFNYKNNHAQCVYVITSNFEKLRFFVLNAVEHIEFNLFTLTKTEFESLWLCLNVNYLLNNTPLKIKEESILIEENITKQLYSDYSAFKNDLWQNIIKNNPDQDQLFLFKQTQKLLDRFLFIFFSEDSGLLPPNSINQIVRRYNILKEEDFYKPLYDIFKQYFNYINIGRKGKTRQNDIFAYNGDLFFPDKMLDELVIDDDVLKFHVLKMTAYDFESEVDVNILGHIFENSLSDIEDIRAKLEGEETDKSQSKRKKDGVFYTPKYITKYIVDNTIGKLCADKKTELKLIDEDYARARKSRRKDKKDYIKKLEATLQKYRDWLLDLRICDPACGSGAFLNQALEFLILEHAYIDELKHQLLGGSIVFQDISHDILQKNIYGVDINDEGVEIAKLSLWLRTALRGRKMTSLNNNIKCGNSLIDDPKVAGIKAFNWKKEFSQVFEKGGFDVVIGNPPYVLCQPSNTKEKLLDFYKEFEVASYKIDLFHLFFEKSTYILSIKGKLGFITPNTYLTNKYIKPLRSFILKNTDINFLVIHEESVFADSNVDVATIISSRTKVSDNEITVLKSKNSLTYTVGKKLQKNWQKDRDNIFNVKTDFLIEIKNCIPLGEICKSYFGIQAYDRKSSISENKIDDKFIEIIDGGDIHSYSFAIPMKFFNYRSGNIKSGGDWKVYEKERVVVRQIGRVPVVGLSKAKVLASNTLYSIYPKDNNYRLRYILCVLNSSLIKKIWLSKYSDSKQLFPKIKGYQLKELPIAKASLDDQKNIEKLANNLLKLNSDLTSLNNFFIEFIKNKLLVNSKFSNWHKLDSKDFLKELKKAKVKLSLADQAEWMQYFNEQKQQAQELKNQIDRTDKEINQMVYDLYDLTEEEIKIVEQS